MGRCLAFSSSSRRRAHVPLLCALHRRSSLRVAALEHAGATGMRRHGQYDGATGAIQVQCQWHRHANHGMIGTDKVALHVACSPAFRSSGGANRRAATVKSGHRLVPTSHPQPPGTVVGLFVGLTAGLLVGLGRGMHGAAVR
jgi:hypothetical protein